jgi:hypothetical protein
MTAHKDISTAAKALELAVLTFDHIEGEYFAGSVSADALRQAWDEREQAERTLEAAHLGHPRPSNDLLTALYRG